MAIHLYSAPRGYVAIFVVNDALTTSQMQHGVWFPSHPYNNFVPASTVF